MTPDKIRIRLAEAEGKQVKFCPIHHSYFCCGPVVPDYATLDDIARVEATLTDEQWQQYIDNLTGYPGCGSPWD